VKGALIGVLRLRALCDPFESSPWLTLGEVTPALVTQALEEGGLIDRPFETDLESQVMLTPSDHARRIAYFVRHGWNDPILVELGVPGLTDAGHWPIEDGNHRFAAAIYRNDLHIAAEVSGEVRRIRKALGKEAVMRL
jgi:hypothetical protein